MKFINIILTSMMAFAAILALSSCGHKHAEGDGHQHPETEEHSDHDGHNHDDEHSGHEGHNHDDDHTEHDGHEHGKEDGHDDDHNGHGHAEEGLNLTREQMKTIGLEFGDFSQVKINDFVETTGKLGLPPNAYSAVSAKSEGFIKGSNKYVEGSYAVSYTHLRAHETR